MATPTKDELADHKLRLIGAIKDIKIKPEKVETADELETFMKEYSKHGKREVERRQLSWLSIFFDEVDKGEVTYSTWKYEIGWLKEEKKYPEDTIILLVIRGAAKGEAANFVILTYLLIFLCLKVRSVSLRCI